jgi:hypothetical protein
METKMLTNRLSYLVIGVLLVVTACAPQGTTTSLPVAGSPTTASLASTNTPPAQTALACPCFEGLSSGLDNAKQARIRAVLSVKGEPKVDVYVNGLPASNGGVIQQNIGLNQFSGWLYVAPGTYTVALVPHGGTLAQALFEPAAVEAEAGHRYTVAPVGQVKDNDVRPLVVDETALETEAGLQATDYMVIVEINNVKGAPAIDELIDQKAGVLNMRQFCFRVMARVSLE